MPYFFKIESGKEGIDLTQTVVFRSKVELAIMEGEGMPSVVCDAPNMRN